MKGEIIAVGTELLLGNITNTNAQFLSNELALCGVSVFHHSVVGDNKERLKSAFRLALSRSDIVFLTGGLGPTTDDITKETVAEMLSLELVENEEALKQITDYYNRVGRQMNDMVKKQALVPKGATVLFNQNGTAPGILIEGENKTVVLLPGPPRELKPMFLNSVVPFLKTQTSECIYSSSVYLVGVGESMVEEKVGDMIKSENPTFALYAKEGEVQIRVSAKAQNRAAAMEMVKGGVNRLLEIFGEDIYGIDSESVQEKFVNLLLENSLTVTTAESLTGGLISQKITAVPGASNVIKQSFVTYCDEAKHSLLGVPEKVLKQFTAVSEKTAAYMAMGAVKNADIAIAATGVAGPGADSLGHEAGEVYLAVADKKRVWVKHLKIGHGKDEREFVREVCAKNALDMARRFVENTDSAVLGAVPHKVAKRLKEKKKRPLSFKITASIISLLLIAALVLGGIFAATHFQRLYNLNSLKSVFLDSVSKYNPSSPVNENGFDTRLDGLCALNPDTVGWLSFDSTSAQFPIVREGKQGDFWGKSGTTPYLDEKCSLKGGWQNLLIYSDAPTLQNPFYEVSKYTSLSFYKKHPNVTFTSLAGEFKYKIFACFYIDESDGEFEYYNYSSFNNIDEMYLYVENVKKRSLISSAVDIREGDSLITFSMPSNEMDGVRLVVAGRKWRLAEMTFKEKDLATLNLTPLYPMVWYEKNGTTPPDLSSLLGAQDVIDVSSEFVTVPIVSEPTSSEEVSSDNTSHDISSDITSSESVSSEPTSSEESSSAVSSEKVSSSAVSSEKTSSAATSSREVSSHTPSRPTSSESASSEQTSSEVSSEPTSSEEVSSEDTSSEVIIAPDKTLTVFVGGRTVTSSVFDIVSQIVANEVGNSSPEEAVKAQAVAAATFVEYYNSIGQAPSVAFREPSAAVKKAVAQVIDERVYYNGSLALTTYGSMAAGRTNNAEDVWGWPYPYLVSVESKYDYLAPNYRYQKTFSAQYVKDVVRQKLGISLSGDENEWFDVVTYTSGGYNGVMSVGGENTYVNSSGKRVNITGRVLRENVFSLRSAKFDVEYDSATDTFTFTTYGYGHGAGMSQWGAILYAQNDGWDYKQILKHYYTGCEVR